MRPCRSLWLLALWLQATGSTAFVPTPRRLFFTIPPNVRDSNGGIVPSVLEPSASNNRNRPLFFRRESQEYQEPSKVLISDEEHTRMNEKHNDYTTEADPNSLLLHWETSALTPVMIHTDEDEDSVPLLARNLEWLEAATVEILDLENYPPGHLTAEDVKYMSSLMVAWSRRWVPDAPLRVESLLKRVVDDMRFGNDQVKAKTSMYAAAMEAWGKSAESGSAERAQMIHESLIQQYEQTQNPDIEPTVSYFNALLIAWEKSGLAEAPARAEAALEQLLTCQIHPPPILEGLHTGENYRYTENGVFLLPDALTIPTVIHSYVRASEIDPSILNVTRCEELFRLTREWNLPRSAYTFTALQNAYVRAGKVDGAYNVLQAMWDEHRRFGNHQVRPTCSNYNAVLNAASRAPTFENVKLADALLKRMEAPVEEGGDPIDPDRLSYALTILASSRCHEHSYECIRLAEATLERMEARARKEEAHRQAVSSAAPPVVRLDVECFNVLLTALSRLKHPSALPRMQRIIRRMEDYARTSDMQLQPNVRTWNTLLNCMARLARDGQDYSDFAYRFLDSMLDPQQQRVARVLPNAFTFAAVLTIFQRSGGPLAAERADATVRRMETLFHQGVLKQFPDVYHYTILCGVWARSRTSVAPTRCLQIVSHMMELHGQGYPDVMPNVRTYNAVLDCLARNQNTEDADKAEQAEQAEMLLYHMLNLYRNGDKRVKPDAFSFHIVISAFVQSQRPDAGSRAEAILERYLEYIEEENDMLSSDDRPNPFMKIISYYAKKAKMWSQNCKDIEVQNAPYRAEYILNRMVDLFRAGRKHLAPSTSAFLAVIDSYGRTNHPDAGQNAERILKLARELNAGYSVNIEMSRVLVNKVLFAWANCDDPDAGRRANEHLLKMEQAASEGNKAMMPDTRSYTLVLSAWTTSICQDKAKEAQSVLLRMKRQIADANPNVAWSEVPFSLAINACAFSNASIEGESDAFRIAVDIFDEVIASEYVNAEPLTYGWFIQCCGRLRVPELLRNAHIERAFRLCCDDGLVTEFVVRRLQGAAPADLFNKLMEPTTIRRDRSKKGRISKLNLPSHWSKRVTRVKRRS